MSVWLVLLGYLIGSIPFAFLIASRLGGIDLRRRGSGNLGATNVFRTTRPSLGVVVTALDIAKGATVVLVVEGLDAGVGVRAVSGVAAVVGHVFPVWLRFRGGKGVATACGVFSVLAPVATGLAVAGFGVILWCTRYVSLASVVAAVLLGPLAYLTRAPQPVVMAIVTAAGLVVARHVGNLARLHAGTERRLGQRA